jgi:hypothetical protein
MSQRSRPAPDDAAVVENFLELGRGFLALLDFRPAVSSAVKSE